MAQTTPRKVVCFHGFGSSATIFLMQARNIRYALEGKIEFIFVDAPIPSEPGPGILPVWADAGPYYAWYPRRLTMEAPSDDSSKQAFKKYLDEASKDVERSLEGQGVKASEISGVMGFSQGTVLGSYLLIQHQRGDRTWANLSFGIMVCGAGPQLLLLLLEGEKIQLPSLHVRGERDGYVEMSRKLEREVYEADKVQSCEFDGVHQMPLYGEQTKKFAEMITGMLELHLGVTSA